MGGPPLRSVASRAAASQGMNLELGAYLLTDGPFDCLSAFATDHDGFPSRAKGWKRELAMAFLYDLLSAGVTTTLHAASCGQEGLSVLELPRIRRSFAGAKREALPTQQGGRNGLQVHEERDLVRTTKKSPVPGRNRFRGRLEGQDLQPRHNEKHGHGAP